MVAADHKNIKEEKEGFNDSILRALFEQSTIGMALFNLEGVLLQCNMAFAEQAGLPSSDVTGPLGSEVFESSVWQQLQGAFAVCENGQTVTLNEMLWTNGHSAAVTLSPVQTQGRLEGVMVVSQPTKGVVVSDINGYVDELLRQKTEELELAKNEIASFSYIASHDLQEPLRKIQTFSNLLIDKEAENLSLLAIQYLNRMNAAAARMQKLIDDLLVFSRASGTKIVKRVVDLEDLFKKILSDRAEQVKEIGAVIEVGKLPQVHGMECQLYMLFDNLLSNALKFTKPGQPPLISIGYKVGYQQADFAVQNVSAAEGYEITISDNGIGFDQQYDKKIFQLFERLHGRSEYAGTGLGLAICKRIVQNHGGCIGALGQPGVGASFAVFLPCST